MILILALACLVGLCHGQAEVTVTLYENANFQGSSKQVTVNRCQNIMDFNDRASSIRTSGCVMLYSDQCCQASSLRIEEDTANIPGNLNSNATSLSPCGFFRVPLPDSIEETWLGHSQSMRKMVEDGDIAVYYNDGVSGTALENHRDYFKKLWSYVKTTYGNFGPEGGRISAFIHANVSGPVYGFNSINNYFDTSSNCRNLIDLVGGLGAWSNNLTGTELDVFTHEVSHIVEGASKGVHSSPAYGFWRDSKWAEIFIYDVYDALGMIEERDRFKNQVWNGRESFPRPDTYWFQNWFYPIYQENGGSRLLNNYFDLLSRYYPRKPNGWQYANENINLGEFVHYFSGAAGKDLLSQAKIAFAWDDDAERELRQAKIDYPDIRY